MTTETSSGTRTAAPFPDGFTWGAATAAYQIEGAVAEDGRTPSIWDTFTHTPGHTHRGDTGDIACDAYHRLETDLDLIASLGLQAYRWSVSWNRIMPAAGGPPNPAGLDFYDRLTDGLLERGIQPVVTLYHWDLPQWIQDDGGWANRDVVGHFSDFAEAVLDRIGDRVPRWVTINEPYCIAFHGHLSGKHAPGVTDEATAVRAAHHVLLAHGGALERIRRIAPQAKAGIALNLSDVHPASDASPDIDAATRVDLVENRVFLAPLLRNRYPNDAEQFWANATDFTFVNDGDLDAISRPMDFLGVNFYEQHHVAADAAAEPSPPDIVRGTRKLPPEPPVSAVGVGVRPDGLYNVLIRLHRDWTDLPMWITENGIALHDYVSPDGRCHDPERIEYLTHHLRAAARAIHDGVPLEAYLAWSLMANVEWSEGYRVRYGLTYVDFATQTRLPKTSAHWFRRVIASNVVPPDGGNDD